VNRKFKFLCRRIREKFLEIHLNGNGDRLEAANALAGCGCRDVCGHENAVVESVEAELNRDGVPLRNTDNTLAPVFDEYLVEGDDSLLTDSMGDIENVDGEWR
jgi:hypothetical protein